MKYRRFESFLREYAKSMNPENTLSLSRSEKLAEGNSRFLSLMTFHLLFDDKASTTLRRNKDALRTLYESYVTAKQKYFGLDRMNLADYVGRLDDFDELKKLYVSYQRLSIDFLPQQKLTLFREIQKLMKQKDISNYQIYHRLRLNPGNTNDFLKHQNLRKMSMENILKVHAFCADREPSA